MESTKHDEFSFLYISDKTIKKKRRVGKTRLVVLAVTAATTRFPVLQGHTLERRW